MCSTVSELTIGSDCESCCMSFLAVLVIRSVPVVAFRGQGLPGWWPLQKEYMIVLPYFCKISVGPVAAFF